MSYLVLFLKSAIQVVIMLSYFNLFPEALLLIIEAEPLNYSRFLDPKFFSLFQAQWKGKADANRLGLILGYV